MMDNTLKRSERCAQCGSEMFWTQNAWPADAKVEAAYRCAQGHLVDPSTTRQCPVCGVHDTKVISLIGGRQQFRCAHCGNAFEFPR
jgi:rubrerythrin